MKQLYCSILFLVLLHATTATAQVSLVASSPTIRSGDSVSVAISVSTRDTLSTAQFTVQWNPAVLSFGRVDTIGGFPPTSDGDEFGFANTAAGKLSFVWTARINANHRPFPDSLVFKIVFKAIGANGTNSTIQFVSSPTAISFSNPRLVKILATGHRNSVVLVGNVSTKDLNTEGVEWLQNAPNPFDNQTVIRFKLSEADHIVLSVFDAQGRLMFNRKGFFAAGEQQIALHTEGVLPNGFYLLSLQTSKNILTKNIIKGSN
jgi:hypothetical protein